MTTTNNTNKFGQFENLVKAARKGGIGAVTPFLKWMAGDHPAAVTIRLTKHDDEPCLVIRHTAGEPLRYLKFHQGIADGLRAGWFNEDEDGERLGYWGHVPSFNDDGYYSRTHARAWDGSAFDVWCWFAHIE